MRLLLGSGGFGTPERRALLVDQMKRHFRGAERVLFVPYALADHDSYLDAMRERSLDAGVELEGIHCHGDPVEAVHQAEAIFIGGGNTFRLLTDLYRYHLLDPIRRRVQHGMPYMGVSAGSNVACPTMQTTNDMPITKPPSFAALGLVPFQINAHYYSGPVFIQRGDQFEQHYGETRDQRIAEYHEMNHLPVLGLWEGGLLIVEDGQATLLGAPARLFVRSKEPVDIEPGTVLPIGNLEEVTR